MHTLIPFSPITEKISLTGDIQIQNNSLRIDFRIEDPNLLIDFNNPYLANQNSTNRTNELWKYTCFEAFWAIKDRPSYWEFNIASNGLWNLYYFDSYKSPNLPRENFDFELSQFTFSPTQITAILDCKITIAAIEASLTAVIKTKSKQNLYFAIQHSGEKPDFHIRESLQLKRSKAL
jgi:hypothetical protein